MYVQQLQELLCTQNSNKRREIKLYKSSKGTTAYDSRQPILDVPDVCSKESSETAFRINRSQLSFAHRSILKNDYEIYNGQVMKAVNPYERFLGESILEKDRMLPNNDPDHVLGSDIDEDIHAQPKHFTVYTKDHGATDSALSQLREIEAIKLKAKYLKRALTLANYRAREAKVRTKSAILFPRSKIRLENQPHNRNENERTETFWELSLKELCTGVSALGLAACKVLSFTGKTVLSACSMVTDKADRIRMSSENDIERNVWGNPTNCPEISVVNLLEHTDALQKQKRTEHMLYSKSEIFQHDYRTRKQENDLLIPEDHINRRNIQNYDEIGCMSIGHSNSLEFEYDCKINQLSHKDTPISRVKMEGTNYRNIGPGNPLNNTGETSYESSLQDCKYSRDDLPTFKSTQYKHSDIFRGKNIDTTQINTFECVEGIFRRPHVGKTDNQTAIARMHPPVLSVSRPGVSGYGTHESKTDAKKRIPALSTTRDIPYTKSILSASSTVDSEDGTKIEISLHTPMTIIDKSTAEPIVKHTGITTDGESQYENRKSGYEANTSHSDNEITTYKHETGIVEDESRGTDEDDLDTEKKAKKKIPFFSKGWKNKRKINA